MEIRTSGSNDWQELRVMWFQIRGDLDFCVAGRTLADYPYTLDGVADALLIDVSDVTFLDCSGIRELMGMQRMAQETGRPVAIVTSGNRFVHRLTSLLALERSLLLYEDFSSGMKALRSATQPAQQS
jgi:anti-anti-sigma regulatory factor